MAAWHRVLVTSILLAVCIAASSAHAVPEPIVFDFEDGLQGWELHKSAQRVQTQLLGGDWAIFGDGFLPRPDGSDPIDGKITVVCDPTTCSFPSSVTSISTIIDLTDIAFVSLDWFFVDGEEDLGLTFVVNRENILIGAFFEPADPTSSDIQRIADLSPFGIQLPFSGIHPVSIIWSGFEPSVGFLDNITFHPVPEPSTLLLLGIATIGLVLVRRRRRGR